MELAGYRLNFDALLARMIYRWHWRIVFGVLTLIILVGLRSGQIPPIWQGKAALTIHAPPEAHLTIDDQPWPQPVYAGDHQIVATTPDERTSWVDVNLTAGSVVTITLPPGLVTPRVRVVPPAAPGMQIAHVTWVDGGWRIQSAPIAPADPTPPAAALAPTPAPYAGHTVVVRPQGMVRLTTLDAYAGLADQVSVNGQQVEAVATPQTDNRSPAMVTVHGWSRQAQIITMTAPLTLVRFNPPGTALLLAEQIPEGAQLFLARPNTSRTPVIAIPGELTRITWHPSGDALVIHSRQGDRLTLTLVRLTPTISAAVVADLPIDQYADDLVPLTWDATRLFWIAPDANRIPLLWQAALTTLIPESRGPLDARAITTLPDGSLRVVAIQDGTVIIGRYQDGRIMGETRVPAIPPVADLAGMWQGTALLLQGGGTTWLVDLEPTAS